jgi:hypothetical protein
LFNRMINRSPSHSLVRPCSPLEGTEPNTTSRRDSCILGQPPHSRRNSRRETNTWQQGYSELRIRGQPNLTPLITYYSQGSRPIDPRRAAIEKVAAEPDSLSAYWEQPGRAILDAGLITVPLPPEDSFEVENSKVILFSGNQRQDLEAVLTTSGRKVENDKVILHKELTWELLEKYCRTWSSLSNYLERFPEEKEKRLSNVGKGGQEGDILDRFLLRLRNEMLKTTGSIPETVDIEWPMTLLLYRKRV